MFVRSIAIVGTGYVGLTTGACLASLRHRVVCADVDEAKVARLCRGDVDIREPGLQRLVAENLAARGCRHPATCSTSTSCAGSVSRSVASAANGLPPSTTIAPKLAL